MPSMMSLILREAALIWSIVVTTLPTTCPPCCATLEAWATSWLAWRAESALCRTVSVSCCMEAEVCCKLDAVSSVRPLRS